MAIYFLFAENSELEHICERRVEICIDRLDRLDRSDDRLDDPIYMLVPKCALSQFANWDPSLRTEIHLSQFAHWAPVPKLGSQFAH